MLYLRVYVTEAGLRHSGVPSHIDPSGEHNPVDGVFPRMRTAGQYEMKGLRLSGEYTEAEDQCVGKRGSGFVGTFPGGSGFAHHGPSGKCCPPDKSLKRMIERFSDTESSRKLPSEDSQRMSIGDKFPQRHVAGERPDMSPGKRAIVVVTRSHRAHLGCKFKKKNKAKFRPCEPRLNSLQAKCFSTSLMVEWKEVDVVAEVTDVIGYNEFVNASISVRAFIMGTRCFNSYQGLGAINVDLSSLWPPVDRELLPENAPLKLNVDRNMCKNGTYIWSISLEATYGGQKSLCLFKM
ncbi:hypothetical protein Tco_0837500 [Tanacetum coccineum]